MISYLTGKVLKIKENYIILLCGNVGYKVFVNGKILFGIKENMNAEFFTHQTFSEYASTLFGFKNEMELEFFEKLIQVSGVGPKLAMNIMESPLETMKHAIINRDLALLVEFPGIGKKTAERLCVELQSKIGMLPTTINAIDQSSDEQNEDHPSVTPLGNEDAFSALQSLGFSRLEAHRMIATVPSNIHTTEEIIKIALQSKK